MADAHGEGQSHARRDELLKWQAAAQRRWADAKVFEEDAPDEGEGGQSEKFFGTFPYPYMNGLLHLGHAFSLSKLVFAAAFHKLLGEKVLFPQGFHCTGMPIKACADKLDHEISVFGNPPCFPAEEEDAPDVLKETPDSQLEGQPGKFTSKKSKAAAKTGTAKRQWDIMLSIGIPAVDVEQFRRSEHWLEFFPPLAQRDITAMGAGVDWRRSFVTTARNPYYDSFIAWQFEVLRRQGRVVKDNRLAVYSPVDGQPCADHDRASGEGAKPQDYTLIKMRALELPPALSALKGKGKVFFMAATLRPETMYGQTNCWVLSDGEYGAFEAPNNSVYIMAARAARNLAWQDGLVVDSDHMPRRLASAKGSQLLGTPLSAPNCPFDRIFVLPLTSISMNKGTGVVTSVPSDSPDDWRALEDLRTLKAAEKYGLDLATQIAPFEVVPIIDIPGLGDRAAETVCKQLGIKNQHETKKLEEAKKAVYLKGFTEGILIIGPHAGRKVSEAKGIIRDELIKAGHAVAYSEPEKQVISRSGDECVVALTDQWYMTYGEPEWQAATQQVLSSMNTYTATKDFEAALDWLNQWACSRSFGLGTRLPWDPQYLIESLSDSTVYMAYYTIAHLLQRGNMYGDDTSAVAAKDLTPEVWDYIFLDGPQPVNSCIPTELLFRARHEFEYWYPMDLRVSGKDLIQNHLSFCLYTHASLWAGRPERQPRAMRTNGHLLLNSEKMSKSTGNFKTLEQAIQEYGADAMRIALADAGDSMEDANFDEKVANAAVLRLTKEVAWFAETLAAQNSLREGEESFADRAFANEMCAAAVAARAAYEKLEFREALKAGWFELQNMRDWYRVTCGPAGMKRSLVLRFMEVQTKLLTPIAPHWAEHVWADILKRDGFAIDAGWPSHSLPDVSLQRARSYLEKQIVELRKRIAKAEAPSKKKKGAAMAATPPAKMRAVAFQVAPEFAGWHAAVLQQLTARYDRLVGPTAESEAALKEVPAAVAGHEAFAGVPEAKLRAQVMPFAKYKRDEARETHSPQILDVRLPFDETALLNETREYILRSTGLLQLDVEQSMAAAVACDDALPGAPRIQLSA